LTPPSQIYPDKTSVSEEVRKREERRKGKANENSREIENATVTVE
jgi:hypothetical protein